MGAQSASFQKIPMPQLEYQQKPDHARPIAIAPEMLIHQSTDRLWFEVPALQSARLGENREQAMLQLVPHPVHQRERKPLLSPVQHFTRNSNPLRQFLQNVFSRSGLKFVLH